MKTCVVTNVGLTKDLNSFWNKLAENIEIVNVCFGDVVNLEMNHQV